MLLSSGNKDRDLTIPTDSSSRSSDVRPWDLTGGSARRSARACVCICVSVGAFVHNRNVFFLASFAGLSHSFSHALSFCFVLLFFFFFGACVCYTLRYNIPVLSCFVSVVLVLRSAGGLLR